MSTLHERKHKSTAPLGVPPAKLKQWKGRLPTPWVGRPFAWGRFLLLLGFLVQLVLLWQLGELVDLSISLMELWAELARKHMELTL